MKSKKILVVGLVLALSLVLTGCKGNDDTNNDVTNNDNQVVSSGEVNNDVENNNDDVVVDNGDIENPDENLENPDEDMDNPVDEYIEQDFEGLSATGEVMLSIVNTAKVAVRAPMLDNMMAEQANMFLGISEDEFNASVESAVFYESMISPANQSFCLLQVKEGADVAALKQLVFEKCNPRKWVCMSAEKVVVVDCGNYVLLAMGEPANCEAMANAMATHLGTELGSKLEEVVDEWVGEGEEDFAL